MAAIDPIRAAGAQMPSIAQPVDQQQTNAAKPKGFGEVLKTYVDGVDSHQRTGAAAMQDLVSGKTKDVLPVVNEVAKADLSFKLLLGVRNKVIEAYKETMRMQV
jgi:flagellar hook-basal body complex protein FliE